MAKVQVVNYYKEGFTSAYGLRFENGMILKTVGNDMLWGGKEKREQTKTNFNEIVSILENNGFEIDGKMRE